MGCMSSKRVIYVTPRPTQSYGGQPPGPERKFENIDEDWDRQSPTQIVTEMCGFVTILSGTFLLHKTKDMVDGLSMSPSIRLPQAHRRRGWFWNERHSS